MEGRYQTYLICASFAEAEEIWVLDLFVRAQNQNEALEEWGLSVALEGQLDGYPTSRIEEIMDGVEVYLFVLSEDLLKGGRQAFQWNSRAVSNIILPDGAAQGVLLHAIRKVRGEME